MQVMSGSVRYFFLKAAGQHDMPHWPPKNKTLEGPDNITTIAVRLYPMTDAGWRAEPVTQDAATPAGPPPEPAFVLTSNTALGLLQDGKRGRAEVGLLGVRVVNLDNKGAEYATHLVVHALPGSGLGSTRQVTIAPIEALVLSEYIEHGDRAEAALDLRISPAEYAALPHYLPDDEVQRQAKDALDLAVQNTARFYSYGPYARHGITLEVESGRVSVYGRVDLATTGEQIRRALEATPGVVEVADHLLYIEDLKEKVEQALAAKNLDDIQVLSEHALIILDGDVPDSKTRYQAEDIAKRTPGVRGVVNNLVVKTPAAKS
jgi:BON domain